MANSKDKSSHLEKQKGKGAIGLMAEMLFNRGSNATSPSSNNNNNTNTTNHDDQTRPSSKGKGGSHRRRGGRSPENNSRRRNQQSNNGSRSKRGGPGSKHSHNKPSFSSYSSPNKSPTQQQHQSEGLLFPPIGLSGPTQFEFSPSIRDKQSTKLEQRYLSFLSCHTPTSNDTNASITGSPVRTMGGGGIPGHNEKRLCAMDLQPFYKTVDLMEQQMRQKDEKTFNYNGHAKRTIEPITDPNLLMDDHVTPLLDTSLIHNQKNDRSKQTNNGIYSPASSTSPTSRNNFGSPTSSIDGNSNINNEPEISLEERLRRERQRLHSNGITQFSWTTCSEDNSVSSTKSNQRSTSVSRPTSPERGRSDSNSRSHTTELPLREDFTRILIPLRGNIYIQDGVGPNASSPMYLLYDKSMLQEDVAGTSEKKKGKNGRKSKKGKNSSIKSVVGRDTGAIDPQFSPDGSMVAFVVAGEIYVMSCGDAYYSKHDRNQEGNIVSSSDDDGRNEMSSSRDSSFTGMIIDSGDDEIDVFVDIKKEVKPTRVTFGARLGDPNKEDDDESDDESDDSSSSSEENSDNHSKMKKRYGRSITNGLADFVAQEEMDRYRGFWWDEASQGILFVRVDESCVPPYRITHQGRDGIAGDESNHEDHRYPFAGENNPEIALGYIPIDRDNILAPPNDDRFERSDDTKEENKDFAELNWSRVRWFDAPDEAAEYLARVNWLPGGSACVQWQDRRQSKLVLVKIDIQTGESVTLHKEQSDVWINLHHMFKLLPHTIHPNECLDTDRDESLDMSLPKGSFSFLFASERTGYCHIYLYTFVPGDFSATLLRAVTAGDWIVESIVGVDMENDMVYVTGTYDSPLERHLYALPLRSSNQESRGADENVGVSGVRRGLKQVMTTLSGASPSSRKYHVCSYDHAPAVCTVLPPNPIRLTIETGMHSIVMDETCRLFVDTCSDLTRPPSSKVYSITNCKAGGTTLLFVLYDATLDLKDDIPSVSAPELISFPTSDGSETLHAAVYYPDKSVHGSGPYPLICAVYGGPHVQRVNRSWCQCADMRAQRLSSMGCVVIKCDNRGSSRRGLAFEGAIKKNLGRVEVLDQVAAVRYLVLRRIADPSRVGIYGWSYGGYLAAMCLCRAPDVFHVAIAGAPVTSWDGYDTHYTERYMGLPSENASGYHEAAVFQHIQNMRGKLLIIHGLIDENVHFRHTARLINRLISGGKDYDLLIFPDERHSPRRLRDRVYMEKRMSDYFVKHLLGNKNNNRGEVMLMGHL